VLSAEETARVAAEHRGAAAAAAGLMQAWSQQSVLVDLANPRKPPAVDNSSRRRRILIAASAACLLLVLYVFAQGLLANKRAAIDRVKNEAAELETNFNRLAQDRADLDGLKAWDQGAVPWIDEFYDLAARFPRENGFHLTRLQVELQSRKGPKDAVVARMTMQGAVPAGKDYLVHQFLDSLRDPHLQARVERLKGGASQGFTIRVDVTRQAAEAYRTRLNAPAGIRAGAERRWPTSSEGGEP
jgi:hypothetical protein